jgi:hypothetical protein
LGEASLELKLKHSLRWQKYNYSSMLPNYAEE